MWDDMKLVLYEVSRCVYDMSCFYEFQRYEGETSSRLTTMSSAALGGMLVPPGRMAPTAPKPRLAECSRVRGEE